MYTLLYLLLACCACSRSTDAPGPTPPVTPPEDQTVVPVADPATAITVGFFEERWSPRSFTAPAYEDVAPITSFTANTVTIDASTVIGKIPPTIFGHNAVAWMGPSISQPEVVAPVTNLNPQVLRFPAGSGSDAYFFNRTEGDRPADVPELLVNAAGVKTAPGYWYGRTHVNWQASLDQYYSLLQQSNSIGMITVNYGYARYGTSADPVAAAAHLAADWVRYDNGRTLYWEIGNENYGDWEWGYRIDQSQNKDGQPEYLTGALYAQHFGVFVDSMRKAAAETGKTIFIGATLYEQEIQNWQTNTVKTWNQGVIGGLRNKHDFHVVHSYFTPYNENTGKDPILAAAANVPGQIMTYINQQLQQYGGTPKPIALTEWNMFARGSRQQVSHVSGLFGIIVQAESMRRQFGMAARWDLVNGWEDGNDHGLFSAGDEPGVAKWAPRPSFYHLYYHRLLMGDRMVPATVAGSSAVKAYASTYTSGQANLTLVNTAATEVIVEVKATNFKPGNRFYYYSLQGGDDNGDFSRKVIVNGQGPAGVAGGPAAYTGIKAKSSNTLNGIKVKVPPLGAVVMAIDKK